MPIFRENTIAIFNTPMAVNNMGELVGNAVDNGYEYEYPVDGISDRYDDEIKPYQIAPYGMVRYSKTLCQHTENANGNAGTTDATDTKNSSDFYEQLDINDVLPPDFPTDTEAFGCMAIVLLIFGLAVFGLVKLFFWIYYML